MAIRSISLCSGCGGLDLAIELALGGVEPLVYIERDVDTASILASRIEDGALAPAHIWSDLATFDARILRGKVDLCFGGLPCQPFSVAGKRLGDADKRYIWPSFFRILRECRPAMVFLENVPTLVTGGWFRAIGEELSGMGYQIEDPIFATASAFGLPHKRLRVFILAYLPGGRILREPSWMYGLSGGGGGAGMDDAELTGRGQMEQSASRFGAQPEPKRPSAGWLEGPAQNGEPRCQREARRIRRGRVCQTGERVEVTRSR